MKNHLLCKKKKKRRKRRTCWLKEDSKDGCSSIIASFIEGESYCQGK
jgi:hypothetical protein